MALVTCFRCVHSLHFLVRCTSFRTAQYPKSSTFSTSLQVHGRQNLSVNHANLFLQLLFPAWHCSLVVAHRLVPLLSLCSYSEVCSSPFYAKGKAYSIVDIYNGGFPGIWTTAQLSAARYDLAATSLPEQSLALFAGGYDGNGAGCCPVCSLLLFVTDTSRFLCRR